MENVLLFDSIAIAVNTADSRNAWLSGCRATVRLSDLQHKISTFFCFQLVFHASMSRPFCLSKRLKNGLAQCVLKN